MAETIREKIISDAMAQLALITVGNGYNYTMSTPLRAQKSFDPSVLPISVVFPQVEENTRSFGKDNLDMILRVESHVDFTGLNASVAQEELLGDLRKNLTNPAAVWSTYLDDVSYVEGGPAEQPEPDNTATAVFILLMVKYRTDIGDPYINS